MKAIGALFQAKVAEWLHLCFGDVIAMDKKERCYRFQEEANELVQSMGMTREEAHSLVDYTWDRPIGEPHQELGGVMVTLAALCHASEMEMEAGGFVELARINQPDVIERIRQKQKTKPHQSALPGVASVEQPVYAQHPDIVGYARTKDLAPLLDESQPDGSYITIGLDHRACWAEEPPYEHLEPLYRKPQPPHRYSIQEICTALCKVPGGPMMTSNQMDVLARALANTRPPVSQTLALEDGKLSDKSFGKLQDDLKN